MAPGRKGSRCYKAEREGKEESGGQYTGGGIREVKDFTPGKMGPTGMALPQGVHSGPGKAPIHIGHVERAKQNPEKGAKFARCFDFVEGKKCSEG